MVESPQAPLLELRGASFGYAGRAVVSGVDLSIERGLFAGIVGPNGAGKSTLFRGILGLIPPLTGSVQRGAATLGYVPQREALDPLFPVSVQEVVHMGSFGRLRGLRWLAGHERAAAHEALSAVRMLEHARAPFSSLSGGQRQRVLIARALLMRPDVLLLDEPTSGVDRGAQIEILELLARLRREQRIAILLVSHQLRLLRQYVGEVIVVAEGRVQSGTPEQMLSPAALDRLYASAAGAELE